MIENLTENATETFDVAVIGGGAAGLSAALVPAQTRPTTITYRGRLSATPERLTASAS